MSIENRFLAIFSLL